MKSQRWGHHARRMERMDTFNTTAGQITGSSGPDRRLGRLFTRMGVATHVLVPSELGSSMA